MKELRLQIHFHGSEVNAENKKMCVCEQLNLLMAAGAASLYTLSHTHTHTPSHLAEESSVRVKERVRRRMNESEEEEEEGWMNEAEPSQASPPS